MTLYTSNELTCRMKMIIIKLERLIKPDTKDSQVFTRELQKLGTLILLSEKRCTGLGKWKKNVTGKISVKMIRNRFDTWYISLFLTTVST